MQQETRRQAMTITPVQLAGSEIYEILKKRLIDELPNERSYAETCAAIASMRNATAAFASGLNAAHAAGPPQ